MKTRIALMTMMLLPGAASAQSSGWDYKATLYAWVPSLSGAADTLTFGTIEFEPDGEGSILDSLDSAFMGSFAASNGKWSFVGDLLYAGLSTTTPAPLGALYSQAEVATTVSAFSGYALYRAAQTPGVILDVGAGFRTFDLSAEVDVAGAALPDESVSVDARWTDPVIAARVTVPFADNWAFLAVADYGGNADGDSTWQAYGGFEYAFNESWSAEIGYRHMNLSRDFDNGNLTFDLGGVVLAGSYSF